MKKNSFIYAIALLLVSISVYYAHSASQTVLRISNYKTGEIYIEVPAKAGDQLFFGWIHSWEKIPWNEYYHIAKDNALVLDTITVTAFGAGIPENKGTKTRIENGVIYMEEIGQVFDKFTWLNSHFAVRDIKLNGKLIAAGHMLPDLTRLNLVVERRGFNLWKKTQN